MFKILYFEYFKYYVFIKNKDIINIIFLNFLYIKKY